MNKLNHIENPVEKDQETLDPSIIEFINNCMQEEESSSQLIAVLHKIQEHYGYLSRENLELVAKAMKIPTSKISGVASFYHYFCLKPRGRYIISVCQGTACFVKGSELVFNKLKEELGIDVGETTSDDLFTLEETRCIGTCALAPVIKIGDDVHAQVIPAEVSSILKKYK